MARTGFDFFISEPNSTDEMFCRVCDSKCRVTRNVFGPTGFASAMAKQFRVHDEFVCPHTDKPWHDRALQLAIAIAETPSKRLAALMKADLDDLLRENLRSS
ncbi:MAG: hypothetical protein HY521_12130 [Proteobacteria bacterium]|nr:hypothetical protein [Pseudomonadota bacterium]